MPITVPAQAPAEKAVDAIRRINTDLLAVLQDKLTEVYKLFWQSHDATPQEIAAAFGTDAAFSFAQHAGLVEHVAEICAHDGLTMRTPDSIPSGWAYSISNDGTMTLVEA